MLPELFRNLFRRPFTSKYPFEESNPKVGFRGYPEFISDKCIGCFRCMRDCPAEAIKVIQVNKGQKNLSRKDRKFKMRLYKDRCIRCGQCVFACPVQALEMNEIFETARFDREEYLTEQE